MCSGDINNSILLYAQESAFSTLCLFTISVCLKRFINIEVDSGLTESTFELLFVKIICLTRDRFSPKLASLVFEFLKCLLCLLVDDFSSTLSSLFSVNLQ